MGKARPEGNERVDEGAILWNEGGTLRLKTPMQPRAGCGTARKQPTLGLTIGDEAV